MDTFNVFVCLEDGQSRCVSVRPSDPAGEALRRVEYVGINSERGDGIATFLRASDDYFFTFGGRPVREDMSCSELGLQRDCVIHRHQRRRGGISTVMIVLIVIGCIFGIWLLYLILPKVWACLKWFWNNIIAPPCAFIYEYIMTPIGHCTRDCVFTTKEACCDCVDSCDTCCSPYKRL